MENPLLTCIPENYNVDEYLIAMGFDVIITQPDLDSPEAILYEQGQVSIQEFNWNPEPPTPNHVLLGTWENEDGIHACFVNPTTLWSIQLLEFSLVYCRLN